MIEKIVTLATCILLMAFVTIGIIKLIKRFITYGFENPKDVEYRKKIMTHEWSDGIANQLQHHYERKRDIILEAQKSGKYTKKYTNKKLNDLNQVVYGWVFSADWGGCPKDYEWDWDKIREDVSFNWPGWIMEDYRENVYEI